MNMATNYNHLHKPSGTVISGSPDRRLTVGDIRDAIAYAPDDAVVIFGTDSAGEPVQFGGFKWRGPDLLQIRFG